MFTKLNIILLSNNIVSQRIQDKSDLSEEKIIQQ